MQVARVAVDGLWRCLCPSIDVIAVSQLSPSVRAKSTRPCIRKTKRVASQHSRSFVYGTASIKYDAGLEDRGNIRNIWTEDIAESQAQNATTKLSLPYANLDDAPISELYDTLSNTGIKDGAYEKITALVEYLIIRRKEKPSLALYDALIRANVDACHGAADAVGDLLLEMTEQNVVLDSNLYHSALQALAIHPDYLLRSEVLREMKHRWYNLRNDGWHHLIVGLLRDRQYESALDKLEQMQEESIRVHPWLYDIFIYIFCESEEFDEALKILQYRVNNGEMDISPNVWYYVLDTCSANYYYHGAQYVWRRRVETSYMNPSDGLCTNVLNTTARYGDSSLARDVIRVLTMRGSKLDIYHYEALLSTYAKSDCKAAFQVLAIMKNAGFEPTESTTRPIFESLSKADKFPPEVTKMFKSRLEFGQAVPIAAVNVMIEACIEHGDLKEAITYYTDLRKICPSGPNTATFNVLLQGCSKKAGNKDLAMFLASEMAALGIRPDILTYDRLVLVCLSEDDYEDAFRYLEEMQSVFRRSELRPGTFNALIRKCVGAGDSRTLGILEGMRRRGHNVETISAWAERSLKVAAVKSLQTSEGDERDGSPHVAGIRS